MTYENVEVLGDTHILFRGTDMRRVVCPVADLQCWETTNIDNPTLYSVHGYRVPMETFDDVIAYLRERA
jgi:hypothetical protein